MGPTGLMTQKIFEALQRVSSAGSELPGADLLFTKDIGVGHFKMILGRNSFSVCLYEREGSS